MVIWPRIMCPVRGGKSTFHGGNAYKGLTARRKEIAFPWPYVAPIISAHPQARTCVRECCSRCDTGSCPATAALAWLANWWLLISLSNPHVFKMIVLICAILMVCSDVLYRRVLQTSVENGPRDSSSAVVNIETSPIVRSNEERSTSMLESSGGHGARVRRRSRVGVKSVHTACSANWRT